MFCSRELAGRIERSECDLIREGVLAASRAGVPARCAEVAGGVSAFAGEGSPLNKIAGLGFERTPIESDLAAAEEVAFAAGCPAVAEVSTLAEPGLSETLCQRGYRAVGVENVLGRELVPRDAADPDGIVTAEDTGDPGDWIAAVIDGFAAPDTQGVASHEEFPREVLSRVIGQMVTIPGYHRYGATVDGTLAGGGSARVYGGVVTLCGAATRPGYRRRGVQTALLARRLSAMQRAGGDLAVVTVMPGSKSQENVQKQGFSLLYARNIYLKEPA